MITKPLQVGGIIVEVPANSHDYKRNFFTGYKISYQSKLRNINKLKEAQIHCSKSKCVEYKSSKYCNIGVKGKSSRIGSWHQKFL